MSVGPRGFQGPYGPEGVTGFPGRTGPQGRIGRNGLEGVSGDNGPIGFQAFSGTQGNTGFQGVQGPMGDVFADPEYGSVNVINAVTPYKGISFASGDPTPRALKCFNNASASVTPVPTLPDNAYKYQRCGSRVSLLVCENEGTITPTETTQAYFNIPVDGLRQTANIGETRKPIKLTVNTSLTDNTPVKVPGRFTIQNATGTGINVIFEVDEGSFFGFVSWPSVHIDYPTDNDGTA